MITYDIEMVRNAIAEVCQKYEMTRSLVIGAIGLTRDRKNYRVILSTKEMRLIPREVVNTYIETLGDKGALEIAGRLFHPVELEESAPHDIGPATDDFWDGDMAAVQEYLKKRLEEEEGTAPQ